MNELWSSVARRDRVIGRMAYITGLLIVLATTARFSFGDSRQAVVRIGDCSGVCVDPSGLVLTVKHCEHRETETVAFLDREVTARRIHVSAEGDGPVVFDCEGEGFPWLRMAERVPDKGSVISSSGYPRVGDQRVFRRETGVLVRGGHFRFQGKPFFGNVTTIIAQGGWSGGPLLDERGDVCGLLSGSDEKSSVFISFASTRKAYDAVKASKPVLLVFSTRTCTGCLKFKSDYDSDIAFRGGLESRFRVEFVDPDLQPELAKQHQVAQVPTFVAPGVRIQGYPGKQELVERLSVRSGEGSPAQVTERQPNVDWSDVLILVLAAEQDVGRIRGAVRRRLLDFAIGPIERRIAEATSGKAAVRFVSERTEPERFRAIEQAASIHVERFFVVVLVARHNLGLKGVIAGLVEKVVAEKLEQTPVDLIFERAHPHDYAAVLAAVNDPLGGLPETSDSDDRDNFPVQETVLGGILAVLTERLKLIRKLQGWWLRRKLR